MSELVWGVFFSGLVFCLLLGFVWCRRIYVDDVCLCSHMYPLIMLTGPFLAPPGLRLKSAPVPFFLFIFRMDRKFYSIG